MSQPTVYVGSAGITKALRGQSLASRAGEGEGIAATPCRSVQGKISVLAPLGTTVLGFRRGDAFEWRMPGRVRRLQVAAS